MRSAVRARYPPIHKPLSRKRLRDFFFRIELLIVLIAAYEDGRNSVDGDLRGRAIQTNALDRSPFKCVDRWHSPPCSPPRLRLRLARPVRLAVRRRRARR